MRNPVMKVLRALVVLGSLPVAAIAQQNTTLAGRVTTESGAPPIHAARDNLASLKLAFAAIASSHRGVPIAPGVVRSLKEAQARN